MKLGENHSDTSMSKNRLPFMASKEVSFRPLPQCELLWQCKKIKQEGKRRRRGGGGGYNAYPETQTSMRAGRIHKRTGCCWFVPKPHGGNECEFPFSLTSQCVWVSVCVCVCLCVFPHHPPPLYLPPLPQLGAFNQSKVNSCPIIHLHVTMATTTLPNWDYCFGKSKRQSETQRGHRWKFFVLIKCH